MAGVPLTMRSALTTWQFAPFVSAVLIMAGAGYLIGVWRVGRRHPARPWPAGRTLAFLLGLTVIAVATQSGIGAYDDVLFSVHMVQHLLLIMVAPPLLVFGRPVTLLLHATGNPVHTWVKRAIRSRAVTALTWPPGAALLYAAVVAGTHLTPFMNLVLENSAVHDAEHGLYLLIGYLYFLPVIGSEPIRWRLPAFGRYLLLLVTMPVDTAVGVILMLLPREPFPAYAAAGRTWGPGLLADLHDGGLIMFAGSDLIMTVLGVAVAVRFVASPARRAGRSISDAGLLDAYNSYLDALGDGAVSSAQPVASRPAGRRPAAGRPLPPPAAAWADQAAGESARQSRHRPWRSRSS
jgi:putative copper resistance protein D